MAELVDATDLKSVDLFNREGSSPSIPKFLYHFPSFLSNISLSLERLQSGTFFIGFEPLGGRKPYL